MAPRGAALTCCVLSGCSWRLHSGTWFDLCARSDGKVSKARGGIGTAAAEEAARAYGEREGGKERERTTGGCFGSQKVNVRRESAFYVRSRSARHVRRQPGAWAGRGHCMPQVLRWYTAPGTCLHTLAPLAGPTLDTLFLHSVRTCSLIYYLGSSLHGASLSTCFAP